MHQQASADGCSTTIIRYTVTSVGGDCRSPLPLRTEMHVQSFKQCCLLSLPSHAATVYLYIHCPHSQVFDSQFLKYTITQAWLAHRIPHLCVCVSSHTHCQTCISYTHTLHVFF